jgi:hypothetical protein
MTPTPMFELINTVTYGRIGSISAVGLLCLVVLVILVFFAILTLTNSKSQ